MCGHTLRFNILIKTVFMILCFGIHGGDDDDDDYVDVRRHDDDILPTAHRFTLYFHILIWDENIL